TSPTLVDQFAKLKTELPNSKWVQYEPINADNAMAGAKMAFGSAVQTIYKFDKAERILTLDADIFSGYNVGYIKGFAAGRKYSDEKHEINRLYTVESTVTLTGAKAEHRLAVKPSQVAEVAKAVAKALGVAGANSTYSENGQWIAAMAKDLNEHKGKSLIVAGEKASPVVHALAHAMNAALGNVGQTLVYADPFSPNTDKTQVEQLRELIADIDGGKVKMLVILGGNPVYNTPADLKLSAERLNAVNKAGRTFHLGLYFDETAEQCQWHVAEKHYLEGWSDARAYDGTASIVQPLIAPLYDGKNVHEVVQLFFKEGFDKKDFDIVKEYWQRTNITAAAPVKAEAKTETDLPKKEGEHATTGGDHSTPAEPAKATATPEAAKTSAEVKTAAPTAAKEAPKAAATPVAGAAPAAGRNFEDNWRRAVHDGFIPNTAAAAKTVSATTTFLNQPEAKTAGSGSLEISILPDPSIYDGRFVNNGWLQELPNPLNKITWENVALVSPRTAQKLQVNIGNDEDEKSGGVRGTTFITTRGGNMSSDLVTLKYQGGEIKAPVPMWISPGQPDDVITIFMGYGRTRAGKVGTGLGYNAFDVRRSDAMDHGFGEVVKRNATTEIASTQIHFNMEGRDILRVWDLEDYKEHPDKGHQHDEYPKSMYPYEEHQAVYNQNYKWGMSIDLNSCVGCNACVVACQSENNIPVVGKEQVERSREMHWLRIDAYYGGDDVNNPEGPHFQPVLCQQCEQAPCEVVCPVHAT
ncbi:MAG: 4Fe-4S dicluster domain-containing protein, partial [Pyrinomonadaceae bacterium]